MNNLLIAISILIICSIIISCNSTLQNDTLFFDGSENLKVITQNTEIIKNYDPLRPAQESYTAKIIADSLCNLYLTVKDINENELKTFCGERMSSFAARPFANEKSITMLWKQFNNGNSGINWSRIWQIVVLEEWLSKNNIIE